MNSFWAFQKYCLLPGIANRLLFSLWTVFKNIPLAWVTWNCYSHAIREGANPNCGRDETLLWLKLTLLWPYQKQSKRESLWALLGHRGLWPPVSLWGGLSEAANPQICSAWRIAGTQCVPGRYPHSSRSDPSPGRRCKSIWSEDFTDLWWEFFKGTLFALTVSVFVHAPEHML